MTRALIAGAAETEYLRRPEGRTTHELLALAVRGALADARLEARDVDGLGVASPTIAPDHAADLAWRLGLRLGWLMEDSSGGASALNLLAHAVRAVEAGDANVVVLVAGDVFGRGEFRRLADACAPIVSGADAVVVSAAERATRPAVGVGRS